MLDLITMSFEIGAIILFAISLIGFGVMVFGYIKGQDWKLWQDIGRAVGHVSTAIMMIIMMAKILYAVSP